MAVLLSLNGRREWRLVEWVDGTAYVNHIATRYRVVPGVNGAGDTLAVHALLSRPGDGSDQPPLPGLPDPSTPLPRKVRPAKPKKPDTPSLF